MTRTVAVVNDAGSAGKTTTTVTLAAMAALNGQSVLLIDLDPQGNATKWCGQDPTTIDATIGDVMLRHLDVNHAITLGNVDGLDLIPANDALRAQRIELGSSTGTETRLRTALEQLTKQYDLIMIDCQAGAGEFFPVAAMIASDCVISVTLPGLKELEGLPRLEEIVSDVAEAYNPDLDLGAIVPCSVPPANRGRIYSDAVQALVDAYGTLVTPPVRQSVVAVTAYDASEPLPIHDPDAPLTDDYRRVYAGLRDRGVLP